MRLWYLTYLDASSLARPAEDESLFRRFRARRSLTPEMLKGEQALIVTEGHIRVVRTGVGEGDSPVTVEVINPTEVLGASRTASPGPFTEEAAVMDSCSGYLLPRPLFDQRVASHGLPPRSTRHLVGCRVNRIENPVRALAFRSLEVRLADLLRRVVRRTKDLPGVRQPAFSVRLAHWQLAHLLCCSRESVELTLESWRLRGWIDWRRGQLIVQNEPAILHESCLE